MRLWLRTLKALVVLVLAASTAAQGPSPQAPAAQWYGGNTHTHTIHSDGDSSPDAVVRWYKEHGYHFVVLTDHDLRTPVENLNALFALPNRFVILAGVEVTDRFQGAPVHMNGIGVRESVKPQGGATLAEMLRNNARAIRAAGGIAQINHPNFGWALAAEPIAAATEATAFEVWNGHPLVNNRGGGGSPSTEEIWDAVLSTGRRIFGVASDDAHHFQSELGAATVRPGTAWIMVRASELTAEAIVAAIEHGDFYASTGVELKSYQADSKGIRLELPESRSSSGPRYRTFFIGTGGEVLKRDESLRPSYEFRGDELYVRVRVEASNGAVAWTQPIFPAKKQ